MFNVTKYPNECNAVFAAGIATIQRQKGTVTMGFYEGHPICKINAPECKRATERRGGHLLYDGRCSKAKKSKFLVSQA